uniref:Ig-like domain-containing protein n=1 Tax=Scylla olivacea TaxID=85551 RepID=A0A0P4WG99_SCYOL
MVKCSLPPSPSNRLSLPVPPRIAPFDFRKNAAEGIRVQVSCVLEQVDLPVSITWLKDGQPLSSHHAHGTPTLARLGLEVRMLDKYSSGLVIPRLQAAHAGNYTCQATNAARMATHTAALAVSGNVAPPRAAPPRPAWCSSGRGAAALHRTQ